MRGRSMVDDLDIEGGLIVELKTVGQSAEPESYSRTNVNFGYDSQGAAYPRGLATLVHELVVRVRFMVVAIEFEPPFLVCPIVFDGSMEELGSLRWERAKAIWARCLKSGKFPGYSTGKPVYVSAPNYALNKELATTGGTQ